MHIRQNQGLQKTFSTRTKQKTDRKSMNYGKEKTFEKPLVNVERYVDFALQTDFITLVALLKVTGLASSGGEAKWMVAEGAVWVDLALELRKSCKIRGGQRVQVGGNYLMPHMEALI
jgi:ribosome-associated protein